MRIVHISDLHFWHITCNPASLAGKRILGMTNLIFNRAWKYRLESMPAIVARIRQLQADHVLITGDLTTTALDQEFRMARLALEPLDPTAASLSIVPGNHDRYTRRSTRLFEKHFADFCPCHDFPWLKRLDEKTSILGLDPTHPNPFSAEGTISRAQLQAAKLLLESVHPATRTVVACHYPVAVPECIREKRGHGLRGAGELITLLQTYAPNIYCHGHIHAAWAFVPAALPRTLCINPGPAVKRSRNGVRARMLEILLDGARVRVRQHQLRQMQWEQTLLTDEPAFFSS